MIEASSGIFTFLFTDIEGSTLLAQKFPESLHFALEAHNNILREAVESNRGHVFDITGDAFCCAFSEPADAVKAALTIQTNLESYQWKDAVIKVRIGIHSGKAEWNGKNYMGYITLARTARIMSAAYGEQILISEETAKLIREMFVPDFSIRDLGERRLKDLIQPIKLFQVFTPELRNEFPPLKTLDARPNNLPVQLTSFIGKQEEMKAVRDLLRQTHLLTLTGIGGAGKTRLAMQLGADVIDEFADGVWIVELASLLEPELLPDAVIQTLGISHQPPGDVINTLIEYLKDKELLLILDNCEHLIHAAAEFSQELLKRIHKLKIIATSREALKIDGEQCHRVLSLGIPNPDDKDTPEQLTQFESVRLFIERALAVHQNFRVNNKNAPALAQICFQLDGIPLAIELAAARTKALSVEQISERLSDRFHLLTGGRRTSLPRQQTLRALIDWSYDLLTEIEKTLWNRLSVFSGGWTLESAEEICADEKIDSGEVIDLLTLLVEKSIVIFNEEKRRFRMLETIKQYGEEKLRESNEHGIIADKHLKHFAELADTAAKELRGSRHSQRIALLDSETGNFEKGLLWSVESSNNAEGCKLAGSLGYYWQLRGHISEAIRWLEAVSKSRPEVIDNTYCKVISHKGNFYRMLSNFEKSGKFLLESLNLSREIGDESGVADTLNRLGINEFDQGRFEEAIKYYEENLAIFRKNGDKLGISKTLNNLGNASSNLGDDDKAMKLYEESLVLRRELKDRLGIAITLNNIGILAFERGDFERANGLLEESVQVRREMGDKQGIAISLMNLGNSFYNQGDFERATDLYFECSRIYEEIGEMSGFSESLYNLGKVEFAREEIDRAEDYFRRGLQISTELRADSYIVINLFGLGKISSWKKDFEQARKFYRESLKLYKEMGNRKDIDLNLLWMSELGFRIGNYSDASRLLGFINEEFLERKKTVFPKSDQSVYDETLKDLKEEMSVEDFAKYFEEGRMLNFDKAIELALTV
jgi:predicted ATPase/class 3 adenylate cyclase/Tfp pilus assembly protein PilF